MSFRSKRSRAAAKSDVPASLPRKRSSDSASFSPPATDNVRHSSSSVQHEWTGEVPGTVHETLDASGEPLDGALRADFESSFGHDFSHVRVHTDPLAAASAGAVDALAYTVGGDVVFGAGQYAPERTDGQQLLAHELSHVVDQDRGVGRGTLQRQPRPRVAPVDQDAEAIIALAADKSTAPDQRAVAVVNAIVAQYFPGDAQKISAVTYKANRVGLHTTSVGRGKDTKGAIEVGDQFVGDTNQIHFARRVVQVGHEIEHIDQYRAGMTGEDRSDEREFIAFYHEATATELPGTGRMQHGTRVVLIDSALGYYYCLDADLQKSNVSRRDELVKRRGEEARRSGSAKELGQAPTSCTPQLGDERSSKKKVKGKRAESGGGLSGGAIAGITLGAIAGAGLIAWALGAFK